MGTIADSLFNVLMSWVRALVNGLWALFSADSTKALEFLGKNWLMIAVVIIACGLVIDWIIWLLRWQPYHLWAQRARRLLRIEEPEEEMEEPARAHAAAIPEKRYMRPAEEELPAEDPDEDTPLYLYEPEEDEEQAVLERADGVSDEELGVYPGMRYGSQSRETAFTQSYSAVKQEGPGAAEVARRRAEIDAWQLQMQEEARARAEAEKAERERAQQEAYEAEQARLAQEAYEAEQARLAQEAYEAEQVRLAQEEYERQLAEYERQKAQYERDLAEYERRKADYEAQLAAQAPVQEGTGPAAAAGASRRRRAAGRTYSDYIEGDAVEELPDAPQWPDMTQAVKPVKATKKAAKTARKTTQEKKEDKGGRLLGRVARMIEPEEEELTVRKTLPPRVDVKDAFRTAKLPVVTPPKSGRRKK